MAAKGSNKQSADQQFGSDREKALETVLAQIDKNYGKGSVMRLGDRPATKIETIPTGSIAMDVALGIGGFPRGRVVEIYGPESSGKTTVALHAVANVQKAGGIAAFIDAEHALDPSYAEKLGVDTDSLLVSQPDTGEQALEIMDMLVGSGSIDIIVIDSVAALVPKAEIEGEMGDSHVGLQARLMSQALRKITGRLSHSNTTAIFINQLREKIGVFFGSPETTTGGKALKFYASVRVDVRRIETLKDGANPVGNRTRAKIVKNKMAPPFKQAEFDILYGEGISTEGGLIDMGVEHGIVKKSGAWFTYEGDQLGQGKENSRRFLKDNPELAEEIERRILVKLGALGQLTASAKSRKQLEDKLADRNVPEDVAREVLDRFEEVDLVDDAQFAELYVRSRAGSRKLSRSAIRRELATRGVTGEIAESALEQRTDEDERADAAELVRRKLPAGAELTDRAERDKAVRRLVGMLGRKGYPPGLAFAVVKEELEARSGAAVQDDEMGEEHPETP